MALTETDPTAAAVDIAVIDDEENLCRLLHKVLRREGYSVRWHLSGADALAAMESLGPARLVITDLRMPQMDGLEVLKRTRAAHPGTVVVIMTAHGSVDTAVEAMKRGAFDYLTKPFQIDEVRLVVRRALQHRRSEAPGKRQAEVLAPAPAAPLTPGQPPADEPPPPGMIGSSRPMRELYRLVRQAAPVDAGILIFGETGTGKELVARAIHLLSRRSGGPFVKVNCAALPETLLESELFGHERGAFTGAGQQRQGRFELADGGTLFLDEIGDIPPATQVRLLRVLQEKEFERVGGTRTLRADVRIVAATHRDLEAAVRDGTFRQDLYYRLHVIPLFVPPLRDRSEDIPALIDHFLSRFDADRRKVLAPETVQRLLRHPWPGNVRELENLIQRLVVLVPHDVIRPEDLPVLFHTGAPLLFAPTVPARPPAHFAPPEQPLAPAAASRAPACGSVSGARAAPLEKAAVAPSGEPRAPAAAPPEADAPAASPPTPSRDSRRAGGSELGVRLPSGWTLEELERAMILQTLAEVGGRRNAAAARLGIAVRTLQYKLKRYSQEGVHVPRLGEKTEGPMRAG